MPLLPQKWIEIISENISKSKDIIQFFGEDWLNNQIYTEEKDYHPIIVVLADFWLLRKLIDDLKILDVKCIKFPRIIRKLKKDEANFFANLSEVDVVAYYYQNHDPADLDYEPSVEGGKNLDLMLKGENGVKYYFEIFTVFEDAIEKAHRDIMSDISLAIGKLNLPYIINFKICKDFKSSYTHDFIDFIKNSVNKNDEKSSFKFHKGGVVIAEFRMIPSSVGGVANSFGPPRFINPHERVKDRILNKLKEQIPPNQNNVLVINLSYVMPLFLVIEEALKLIDYPQNITMIIAYVGNDYKTQKRFYPNPDGVKVWHTKLFVVSNSLI